MRVFGDPHERIQSALDDILGERNQGLDSMRDPCRNLSSAEQDPIMAQHLEFSNGVWNMLRSTFVFWVDAPKYENPNLLRFGPHIFSDHTLSISQQETYVCKNGVAISRKFDLHASVRDRLELVQLLFQRLEETKKTFRDTARNASRRRRARAKLEDRSCNGKVQKKNTAEHRMHHVMRCGGKENLTARYRTISAKPMGTAKDHKPMRPSPLGLWNIKTSASSVESTAKPLREEKNVQGEG